MLTNRKKLQYALLCSVFFYGLSAQAANFGPGGTTLTTAYTNASGTTINSQGFLTLSGSSAVFTNAVNATFNNATPTPGYLTSLQSSSTFNNSGTANFAGLTLATSGKYNTQSGGTTIGGALSTHSATFTNSGTTTFSSLAATGGNGTNTLTNSASNFTITGASTIDNSNFTNTANSATGSATFGGNVSITNSSKFTNGAAANTYGSTLVVAGDVTISSAAKLYNYNGNMTFGSLNMGGTATALNDAKGILTVNGAAYMANSGTTFKNSGKANFNSTLMATVGSSITNNAGATLNTIGLTSLLGASTLTNSGSVTTGGLSVSGGSTYTNNANSTLTAGATTILGQLSRLNNSGIATLSSLNSSNTDVFNVSSINNNVGGALSVTGNTILGFTNVNNYGTMNLNTLTAQEFTRIVTYTDSTTNISGVTTISGGDTQVANNGKMSFGDNLLVNTGATLINNPGGNMSVTGSSLFDQASFTNYKGTADFEAFTAQNVSYFTIYDGSTTNIKGAGIFTDKTLMVNSGIGNFNNTLSVGSGTRMINNSTGKLNVIDTTIIDASTFTNDGTANLNDLYVQNGSTLKNTTNANLTSSGTTTITGNGSTMANTGILNLNNFNVVAGAQATNNKTLNATGTTIIDASTFANDGTANLDDLYVQNSGSITNNSVGELNAASTYIYNNSTLKNVGVLELTSLTTDASNFYNNSIATIGNSTVSNNSLFTNDANGTLMISGDFTTSNSQILNKGVNLFVNGISSINKSTIDNYSMAGLFETVTLTDSTFNNYAGSTLSSRDFNLNASNFNMTSSIFNSAGKINIDSKSLLTVDSGLGYGSTSTISAIDGLDIYGTLTGSASVTGDITVEDGGTINLLATDILNVNGNINFKNGSTYYTTIDVRDAHDITDTVSLINVNGAVFEDHATISIGSDVRPNELSKKYPIMVANSKTVSLQQVDLRTSLLLNYNAFWEKTGADEYTLYVQIDTNPIKNVSGITYNESQIGNAFGALTLREDLPAELEEALNYVYTQVATEASLGRLFREYSLETPANYLNYMPTLNRMMTQGAETHLTDSRAQNLNTDKSSHLWITPFGARSKQDHSKDIINQDIQGFDADVWGLTAGVDKQFKNGLLGAMVGWGNVNFKGDYTNDKIESNGLLIGIYGSTELNNWFVDSKASYTHLWNESKTTYDTPVVRTTKADYGTDVYAFDVKGGYTFKIGRFNLSPSIGADVVHARQQSFTEEGAGGLSRDVKRADMTSVELPVKMQLDWVNTFANGVAIKPKLYVEYAREVGDSFTTLKSTFIGSGGSLISSNSMYNDRNRYTIGTDVGLEMTSAIELGLKYNADFRKNYTNNTFMLNGEYKF